MSNNLTLTFLARQAVGAGYPGLTRTYDVETATALTNATTWVGLADYTDINGANQTVTVTQPIASGPHFYRLKVRLIPAP